MLEAKNIHKIYYHDKQALAVLKGVDLEIEKGKFIALVGPSGAGKSTLLHILGGLDSPSQGEVIYAGENIYRLSDSALARVRNEKIGFVFQFYHLLPEFNVLENVLLPALISVKRKTPCLSGRQENVKLKEKALELLNKVGLGQRVTHFPGQLSGGEKQRVAIARGLMNNPGLLLCDEPTGNLDSESGQEIVSLISKINRQNLMTVVLVTHNPELAKIADKIYHLRDGVLVN